MVEREGPLSLRRQCQLLGLNRGVVYYEPVEIGAYELELMSLIDRQYLRTPFYGSRRMTAWLQSQGHAVNRKRVQRLMQGMGLEVIYQRPRTSRPAPGHRIYPYLLRGLSIERVHQVWAADITYIPMAQGFLYLVAVMDWVSRYVLAWRLSNLLEASFCIEALEEALGKGRPEIFNTDQGSQFTNDGFTSLLRAHGVAISMDGRGRECGPGAPRHRRLLRIYNHQRLHQALGYRARQLLEEGLGMSPASLDHRLRPGHEVAPDYLSGRKCSAEFKCGVVHQWGPHQLSEMLPRVPATAALSSHHRRGPRAGGLPELVRDAPHLMAMAPKLLSIAGLTYIKLIPQIVQR